MSENAVSVPTGIANGTDAANGRTDQIRQQILARLADHAGEPVEDFVREVSRRAHVMPTDVVTELWRMIDAGELQYASDARVSAPV